ncbi:unnamed protein product [Medioppia subpectinata]|uniref:Uncharacterized protein n=1 Tax=Medioppia subpectinata TaxID=1979941 RepID=A0A7R9Q186_9ACAR|nr:unnamed protein product [Medioppia subpectinata]CAG2108051.1 unnamed protein product [Medioppia subpectinata]
MLFESLLYSAISQLDTDLTAKKSLIRQIYGLIDDHHNNNDYNAAKNGPNSGHNVGHRLNSADNSESLIAKYESMNTIYEKCFLKHFNNDLTPHISPHRGVRMGTTPPPTPPTPPSPPPPAPDLSAIVELVIDYATKGQYNVAIPLCKEALTGVQHRVVMEGEGAEGEGSTTDKEDACLLTEILGLMHLDRQEYTESEPYLRQALDARHRACGSHDRHVIKLKTHLSHVLFKQQRYKESELMAKQVLTAIYDNETTGGVDGDHRVTSIYDKSCVWEMAEELEVFGAKDYSLVSEGDEHRRWHHMLDQYADTRRLLHNLSSIYAQNDKTVAAEVIADVIQDLQQDIYEINQDFYPKIKRHIRRSSVRHSPPGAVTLSTGCQTDVTDLDVSGDTHGQLACTATDVNLCRNSVPPGPTGVFSYLSCQRPSNRMRTCIYTCNAVPCDVTCANTLDYQRGECIYDVTRTTTSCMCFRQ